VSPVAVSLWGRHTAEGRAQLTANGFTDVVVAISPDIPEDPAIIDTIKVRLRKTVLQIRHVIPNPTWIHDQKGTGPGSATKNLSIYIPKHWH
jgi:hypothetical protein